MIDEFPVHEELEVLDGKTIFKSSDWLKAVVLYKGFSGREIGIYLWKQTGDSWKRQQKYVIRSKDDWETDQEAVKSLLEGLAES
jgi:hypothetical protein